MFNGIRAISPLLGLVVMAAIACSSDGDSESTTGDWVRIDQPDRISAPTQTPTPEPLTPGRPCDSIAVSESRDLMFSPGPDHAGSGSSSTNPDTNLPIREVFEFHVSAPTSVRCGQPVPLTLEVTYIGSDMATIYAPANFDDFVVSLPDGTRIWSWWHKFAIPALLQVFELQPGESFTVQKTWLLDDLNGDPVSPGTYVLHAETKAGFASPEERPMDTAQSDSVQITVIR